MHRPYLLFHAGSHKFSRCRWELTQLYGSDPRSLVRPALNVSDYVEGMRHSRYCVLCGGYAPYTPRLTEALHAECVPIFVREHWLPPFADLLNYSAFSLSVSLAQIGSLSSIAEAADHPRLLEGVRRARSAFEYHLDGYTARDMLPLLVHSMHVRLQLTATAPPPLAARRLVEPIWNSVRAHGHYTTRWAAPFDADGRPARFERAVLWQRVGELVQNLSHNRPRGDASYRVRVREDGPAVLWHCRTAPINMDARQCVCLSVGKS